MRLGPAEDLLTAVARYRCLSSEQASRLLFWTKKQTTSRLRRLLLARLLVSRRLPGTPRIVYFLTARAFTALPRLSEFYSRSILKFNAASALAAWQRAEAVAHFVTSGWRVERDYLALRALRSDILARLNNNAVRDVLLTHNALADHRHGDGSVLFSPYRCPRCGYVAAKPERPHVPSLGRPACIGRMKRSTFTLYDIAHRPNNAEPPFILLVDNPYRSVRAQLEELPVTASNYDRVSRTVHYQPSVRVLFLPSEDGSLWDPARCSWLTKGPRQRTFEALTRASRTKRIDQFPFYRTVESIVPPNVYLRQIRLQENGVSLCRTG